MKKKTDISASSDAFVPTHTIGIDLGDKRHAVCILDHTTGEILEEFSLPNTRPQLGKLAARFPKARIAMEVGTHSPWISRLFQKSGLEVIVANSRKLRAIYRNDRKSDELDARMLARLARADVSLLPSAINPAPLTRRFRSARAATRNCAAFSSVAPNTFSGPSARTAICEREA